MDWQQSCRAQPWGGRLNWGPGAGNSRFKVRVPTRQTGAYASSQESHINSREQSPGRTPGTSMESSVISWPRHQVSEDRLVWGQAIAILSICHAIASKWGSYAISLVCKFLDLVSLPWFQYSNVSVKSQSTYNKLRKWLSLYSQEFISLCWMGSTWKRVQCMHPQVELNTGFKWVS